jgi:hypothetical protein
MKCFAIPEIIGATGIVTRLKEYLEMIPGKQSIDFIQKKTAVLGTSHIINKVLQTET